MLITLPFYNHWLASQIGKYVFTLSTVWSMEYVQQQQKMYFHDQLFLSSQLWVKIVLAC